MLKIQLGNKWIDTYAGEKVELAWDGFRFMKSLRAGYTNDLLIPKTSNNLDILGAVGLLDSQTQLFGDKTAIGILQLEVRMIPIHIQVAGVTKTDIKICLYEDSFPEYFKEKTMRQYFQDSPSTIWEWNESTQPLYPDVFMKYNYGMPYDTNYAQYHPVRRVNNFISDLNYQTGYNMPLVSNDWYMMATRKVVCPQNQKQIIEGFCDFDTSVMRLSGGQHITNDLRIQYGDGVDRIYFNRSCKFNITLYVSWLAKNNSYSVPFIVNHHTPDGQNDPRNYNIRGDLYRNKIDIFSYSFNCQEGSTISMSFLHNGYYEHCRMIAEVTITDYEIREDDYDEELDYIGRLPRLVWYDWNSNRYYEKYWDGTNLIVSYKIRGQGGSGHMNIQTTFSSLSYFGYWANVPDFKICDFWYSMQWLTGQKLDYDHKTNVTWRSVDESAVIQGTITEIRPKSDKLGQKNYLSYQNDDTDPIEVSEIANEWLAPEATFGDSKFTRVLPMSQFSGKLNQYSDPEHDSDTDEYKCSFHEYDDPTIWWNVTNQGGMTVLSEYIRDIPIPTMNLEKLTQSMEVDIVTFTPQLRDKDILYLDGRKFFIVKCKTDIETQKSELTCLLVPNPSSSNRRANQREQNANTQDR